MDFKRTVFDRYKVIALKPLEHFKNSGLSPFWSIQTDRTHGKKGVIKVSKSKLEDPGMAMTPRPDYHRMAGAEDIYQGDKAGLLKYIKETYKNFKTVEFSHN